MGKQLVHIQQLNAKNHEHNGYKLDINMALHTTVLLTVVLYTMRKGMCWHVNILSAAVFAI